MLSDYPLLLENVLKLWNVKINKRNSYGKIEYLYNLWLVNM